jgi:RNA polymerase sigma factor (sigma-70 family)
MAAGPAQHSVRGQRRMTEDGSNLWDHPETARKELILYYLPLVEVLAKRIARSAGGNWEDLRQDGVIGLIKAIARFDPGQGVPFEAFARHYIRGAILDSSELTRSLARRQEEIYRKVRFMEGELTKTLQRNPTIEEVAEKTGLSIEQILNAIDARGVAFAGELPEQQDLLSSRMIETPQPERTIFLLELLSLLSPKEKQIIHLYYWEDQSHDRIAQTLGLAVSNITKIRQRAIKKLREWLGVNQERQAG